MGWTSQPSLATYGELRIRLPWQSCKRRLQATPLQIEAGASAILTQPPLVWPQFEAWMVEAHRYSLTTRKRVCSPDCCMCVYMQVWPFVDATPTCAGGA